jgi:ABC-type uncharacterized transport system permease subunit
MLSSLLYFVYGAVMLLGLVCFVRAFQTRLDTPVHKRWGLRGAVIALAGIAVVVVATYLGGEPWQVKERFPDVVLVHRAIALLAFALLLLTAFTGMRRHRLHPRLYVVFMPVYVLALVTAAIGYRP